MGERRYFAFLRAINTGHRRLTNEQLLAPFRELGFTDVAAYQAAGNVTFRCADADADAAVAAGAVDEQRIGAALADAYGFVTPTFVRTAAEVDAIVDAAPFADADLVRTAGKVQVTFLRRAAPPESIAQVMALVPPDDRVVVSEREWYWLPVEGVSTSTLPVGRIESLLGEMTMRTLGTVARFAAKFAS